ncbi:MAG: SLC26A/SulP transporter family protein [Caldilineaceae bacterium]|nr:SLC26A/SulP transporter family protein [Caldilineaceae bacterium]
MADDTSTRVAAKNLLGTLGKDPEKIFGDVLAGLVVSLVAIIFNISYAALIFTGPLAEYLPFGITASLLALSISAIVVPLFSSLPILCAGPDSLTAAVVALITANAAAALVASGQTAALFPTILLTFVFATTSTGVVLWLAGRFQLGHWVRYIPYPVIGGFLAGTGWLVTRGGIKVMTAVPLEWHELDRLLAWDALVLWGPGLFFGLALLLLSRFYKHFLLIPIFVLAATALFYLVLAITGTSLAEAAAIGWFFTPFAETVYRFPLTGEVLSQVSWSVLLPQTGTFFALFLITIIDLLLVASGLELALQRNLDLNRELRVTGLANAATGFFGGFVSCLSTSRTLLAQKAGATGRLSGLVVAAVGFLMLLFGDPIVAYVPKAVLGGLLIYLGLSLLVQWLYESWYKLHRADYALIWIILLAIGAIGLLQGIGVGIVIASIIFTVTYSQIPILKHDLVGADYPSTRTRTFQQQRYLTRHAQEIRILRLQGYLFFGTTMQLVEYITKLVEDETKKPLFLALDFHYSSGMDASALLSFTKLQRLAREQEVTLIYTGLHHNLLAQFEKEKIIRASDHDQTVFVDLDHGLEWCEEQLLQIGKLQRQRFMPLALQLDELFPDTDQVTTFMDYLEARRLQADETLIAEGEKVSGIYLIEHGQVTIAARLPNGQTRRVATLGSGAILAEWQMPANGYATVNQRSQVYSLTNTALQRMVTEQPALAVIFFRFIAEVAGEQLMLANTTIDRLLT